MSESNRCETCRWWERRNPELGECRRNPPRIVDALLPGEDGLFLDAYFGATGFPVTLESAWCGEWKETPE